jgi:hypothetical protein
MGDGTKPRGSHRRPQKKKEEGFRGRPGGEEARRRREECKNESEE